jgi:hypothetical protein
MASLGHSNDLTTTTLTILGTLNNSRKIENLNLGTVVLDLSGDGSQGCELVSGSYRTTSVLDNTGNLVLRTDLRNAGQSVYS